MEKSKKLTKNTISFMIQEIIDIDKYIKNQETQDKNSNFFNVKNIPTDIDIKFSNDIRHQCTAIHSVIVVNNTTKIPNHTLNIEKNVACINQPSTSRNTKVMVQVYYEKDDNPESSYHINNLLGIFNQNNQENHLNLIVYSPITNNISKKRVDDTKPLNELLNKSFFDNKIKGLQPIFLIPIYIEY
ncbi:hypothetical protein COBT_000165 [Conglomerata obtusa]